MAYYTSVLPPNEQVKYVGSLLWMIYKNSIAFGVLAVIAALAYSESSEDQRPVALIAVTILLLLAVISFVRFWSDTVTTKIVAADKRITHEVGWIVRRTEEMNITKVETVDVSQGIAGRILGFGTVLIRGIGGSWEPPRRLASPLELRNAITVG